MTQDITTIWKNRAAQKLNTASDHITYAILRAMMAKGEDKVAIAKHFLRKAFSPITRPTKLANGAQPFAAIYLNHPGMTRYESYKQVDGKWTKVPNFRNILGVPANELLSEEEMDQFDAIAKQVSPQALVRRYSYFFTRQDIFDEYQLVQTAHVALELGAKLNAEQVKDLHFTCCGVADVEELEAVERVLESMKVPYITFREPDIGNQKTAIGVYPLEEHKRGLLRSYNLLRFNRPTEVIRSFEVEEVE
jgi:hypothetical protein